jgi:hypothetical protein
MEVTAVLLLRLQFSATRSPSPFRPLIPFTITVEDPAPPFQSLFV